MGGRKRYLSILVGFFLLALIAMEAGIAGAQVTGGGVAEELKKNDEKEKLKKEEEKVKKDEEKLKKDEEKLKKDEEKLKKDEEKLKKDEEKNMDKKKVKKEEEKVKKEEEKVKKEEEKVKKEEEKLKKEKEKKKVKNDAASTHYKILTPLPSGQERAFCQARGACYYKTLVCPSECMLRKPKKNKKHKGCFLDCSSKCEATCKYRKPNCNGYGALCYDPRFVGGDGVMFYFHGTKGANFAIVSDENLHINAHFIGTRPQGRTRDFTWVQAIAVIFDSHTLLIAANKVSHWNDTLDSLRFQFDGEPFVVPSDDDAEWRVTASERQVVVERTDEVNSVRVTIFGLVEMDIKVRAIGEEENRVHKYEIPEDDAFAHLETQFRFVKLSKMVEGVLGKTYREGYVSPVKKGVPMPIMGGEDRYRTPSLFSTSCKDCRFQRPSSSSGVAQY